jgi:hypothetical protein
MTYYFFNSIGFAKDSNSSNNTDTLSLLVGFNSHLHELRFRFSGFSGFNTTSNDSIFFNCYKMPSFVIMHFPGMIRNPMGRNKMRFLKSVSN